MSMKDLETLSKKRFALTIVVEEVDENGEFIPCVAVEGAPGYRALRGNPAEFQTPWHWGKDYNKAVALCEKYNEEHLGLNKIEAWKIVASTMKF